MLESWSLNGYSESPVGGILATLTIYLRTLICNCFITIRPGDHGFFASVRMSILKFDCPTVQVDAKTPL